MFSARAVGAQVPLASLPDLTARCGVGPDSLRGFPFLILEWCDRKLE